MPCERTGAVAGIVLAAGASTRLGRNKLFVELEGESLLRRAVRRVSSAGLDPVVVVLGHEADRARDELAGLSVVPVLNADYMQGVNSSVRAGIEAVSEAAAAVVVLADMPFVTTAMIAALVERYRASTAPLVISDYGGVNAPPMLYDRSLFDELVSMQGEGCGKQVVKRHRDEALAVSWPADALTDLDVPEDYDRVKALVLGGEATRGHAR
jgi:molybdenum cofactor cytidylyltransferase